MAKDYSTYILVGYRSVQENTHTLAVSCECTWILHHWYWYAWPARLVYVCVCMQSVVAPVPDSLYSRNIEHGSSIVDN